MFTRAARSGRGLVGLALVLIVLAISVIGPLVAPYSPTAIVSTPYAHPSGDMWLGADMLGRDALSRVLAGGRSLLAMAVLATALSVGFGSLAGMCAAYYRGKLDALVMRVGDVVLAFPQLVFALLLVSVVGPHWWLIVLAIALSQAPQIARVMRSATLDVSERDYVRAAEAIGTPSRKVVVREILPNVATPLTVELGLRLTYSIIAIAGLSFLGVGQQPPDPNWGVMVNENRLGLQVNPWPLIVPVVLIALLTVGTNLFTDSFARAGLRLGARRATRDAGPTGELTSTDLAETVVEGLPT